jgi:hypothetical protein
MYTILIISFSDIGNDPRVSRQIKSLVEYYPLTVAGRGSFDNNKITFVPIIPRERTISDKIRGAWLLKTNQFAKYYWGLPDIRDASLKLGKKRFDLIIANDVETLPLALNISPGARVLLDAHEYAPKEFEDRWVWSFFTQEYTTSFFCREHLPRVHSMMTVCDGIAEEYARNFPIPKPFVVLNAPRLQHLEPQACGERIRLIHHGKAIPSRKLELMIDMMDYLDDRFLLDIMLIEENTDYLNYLKKKATPYQRIRFIPSVPMQDITRYINMYDIGLFLLPPTNINYSYALPNKFFEFIQGRLAVAIGPSPEMAKYVRHYNLGVVSQDFSPKQLVYELNRLSIEQISQFKKNSHTASQELCFEKSERVLLEHIQKLLSS